MKIGLTCRAKIAMSKQCTLTSFFDLLPRRPVVESADFDEQVQELGRRAAAALQVAQDISVDAQKIHRDLTECIDKEPARKKPAAADATATAMVQELGVDAQKTGTSRCPLSFTLSAHLPELTDPTIFLTRRHPERGEARRRGTPIAACPEQGRGKKLIRPACVLLLFTAKSARLPEGGQQEQPKGE